MIGKMFLSILNMSFSAGLLILAVIVIRFIILHRIPRKFICMLWAIVAVRLILPFSIESPFSLIPSASPFQVSETVVQSDSQDLEKPEQFGQQSQKPSADVTSEDILQVHSGFAFLDTVTNEFLESRPLQVHVHRPTVNPQEGVMGENKGQEGFSGDWATENNPSSGLTGEILTTGDSTEAGTENPAASQPVESVTIEKSINMVANIWRILPLFWYIGVVAILGYAFYSYFRLGAKLKVSIEQEKGIFICDAIDVPFVFGLLAPKVYLPSDMEESAFAYVVEHEKMHMARKDHLWKAIGYLLLAIHWMNPLVWVSYVLFCRDVELACDEAVIQDKTTEFKKEYAMTLFSYSVSGLSAGFLPLAFGEGSIKDRIVSVMRYKKPTYIVLGAGAVLCVIVAVLFLTNPKKEVAQETNPSQETVEASNPENPSDSTQNMQVAEKPEELSKPEGPSESEEFFEPENPRDSIEPITTRTPWWEEVMNECKKRAEDSKIPVEEGYLPPEDAKIYHSSDDYYGGMRQENLALMEKDGLNLQTSTYYEAVSIENVGLNAEYMRPEILVINPEGSLSVYVKDMVVNREWVTMPDTDKNQLQYIVWGEKPSHKIENIDSLETALNAGIVSLSGSVGEVPFYDYFAEELRQFYPGSYQKLLLPDTALRFYLNLQDVQTEWILSDEREALVTCTFQNGETAHYVMEKKLKSAIWQISVLIEEFANRYRKYIEHARGRYDILYNIDVDTLKNETVRLEYLKSYKDMKLSHSYTGYAIISELEDEDTVLYGYWDDYQGKDVMALRKGDLVIPLYIRWDNMHHVIPELFKGDFDGDGETEYGIVRCTGTGSGVSTRGLHIIDFDDEEFFDYELDWDWDDLLEQYLTWNYDKETNTVHFYDGKGKEISTYVPKIDNFSDVSFGMVNDFVLRDGQWYLTVTGKVFPGARHDENLQFTCQLLYDGNGHFSLGEIVPTPN